MRLAGDLKYYTEYLRRIKAFAKVSDLRIIRQSTSSDGELSANYRIIYIDPDLTESTEISTLLHELGHAFDHLLRRKKRGWTEIDTAYWYVYNNKSTKQQLKLVIQAEERAWAIGRLIAKRLRIKLGKWYENDRASAIKGYKS